MRAISPILHLEPDMHAPGRGRPKGRFERRHGDGVEATGGGSERKAEQDVVLGPSTKNKLTREQRAGARERVLTAAYQLFSRQGLAAVGVDTIIARSGAAKMSLYRHFRSKDELIIAFLERRKELWTLQWLEQEISRRESDPVARLLAIFDVFDGWFQQPDFEGCSFINVLIEAQKGSAVGRAAALQLAEIRAIINRLAEDAQLDDVDRFAHAWHILMKGSIIAAREGQRDAAQIAKDMGRLILASWPRRTGSGHHDR
jgi:AcrR family transcriptional regulator